MTMPGLSLMHPPTLPRIMARVTTRDSAIPGHTGGAFTSKVPRFCHTSLS
jgi:hypothetical protein